MIIAHRRGRRLDINAFPFKAERVAYIFPVQAAFEESFSFIRFSDCLQKRPLKQLFNVGDHCNAPKVNKALIVPQKLRQNSARLLQFSL